MKERPILFTGDEVRATLEGRKSQFRRPVKPQPIPFGEQSPFTQATLKEHVGKPWMPVGGVFQDAWKKPFGTVGDRLWVRETFCHNLTRESGENQFWYAATDPEPRAVCPDGFQQYRKDWREASPWISPIHMPRWASRIDLEITAVRVERVQDITEEDAEAEGVIPDDYEGCEHPDNPTLSCAAHRYSFRDLWQSIYGTRPSLPKNKRSKRYERVKRWLDRNPAMDWDANPWVWVYEFRRIKP